MSTLVKIIVVDDHQLFREAVVAKLEEEPGFNVVGQIDNAVDTLLKVREKKPDIVLMDISLEGMGGLETIKLINVSEIETRVIILSMHNDHQYVGAAIALGVWGYVRKQEAFDDLILAINSVVSGKRYYSPALNIDTDSINKATNLEPEVKLTVRELGIVTLVAKGLSNQEIATLEKLSIKTIETHRANINRKLQARNSADVTRYAIRTGLILP